MGKTFEYNYPSRTQRAEAILNWVQMWTQYGHDRDWVTMKGEPQEEWAWNADEMMHAIDTSANTLAIGDCEDLAFLCALLYMGANFDVAMVDAPEHVALLIFLPEYPSANMYHDIDEAFPVYVDYGIGWIWVEATGDNNPLGWTPPDFINGGWDAYPITAMIGMRYLSHATRRFGYNLGDSWYDSGYDIDSNGKIDIFDIAFAWIHWPEKPMPLQVLR